MTSSSIIIFGILSELLLISLCISLNISKFYNESEIASNVYFDAKPTMVLRDRIIYIQSDLAQKEKR